MNTKWKVRLQVGFLTLALTVPSVAITPIVAHAQTQSKENRDDRQSAIGRGVAGRQAGGPPGRAHPKGGM